MTGGQGSALGGHAGTFAALVSALAVGGALALGSTGLVLAAVLIAGTLAISGTLRPATLAYLLLFSAPFSALADASPALRASPMAVAALWLLVALRSGLRLKLDRMDLAVGGFVAVSVLSALFIGHDRQIGVAETFAFGSLYYYIVSRSIEGADQARHAAAAIALGFGAAAALALLSPGLAARRVSAGVTRIGALGSAGARPGDPIGADRFAGELVVALWLAWFCFRRNRSYEAVAARVMSLFSAVAFLLAVSRGATLALGGATLGWAVVAPASKRLRRLLAVAALTGLAILLAPSPLQSRFAALQDPSSDAYSRAAIWRGGVSMFRSHPILGVGVGNYPELLPQYLPSNPGILPNQDAHSIYVGALAETGLIGFVPLAVALALVMGRSYRRVRAMLLAPGSSHGGWDVRLMSGIATGLLALLIAAGNVDLRTDRLLYAMLGLLHAALRSSERVESGLSAAKSPRAA